MKNVTIWPAGTVPQDLVDDMLDFYRKQQAYDHNFGGKDKRGIPPQRADLPQLYDFIESLGYKVSDIGITGNYLETAKNYPIHADTSRGETNTLDYTIFLFPLYIADTSNSYLFLLNQHWSGEASTFVRQPWPKGWNDIVSDYNDPKLSNVEYGTWDNRLRSLGISFTPETLDGMSLAAIYKWKIGTFASFPCTQLHFAVNDSNDMKVGLSLRLKRLE
jgi:hypothetical protein